MAAQDFTAELAEQLYRVPKYIPSKISWKGQDQTSGVFRFVAQVLTEDGLGLELYGHWQRHGRHGRAVWGFSLAYQRHQVRSYDMALRHRNPGGGSVRGPHKHLYRSSKIQRFAYKPNPAISEANPNRALLDFLEEGNGDNYHKKLDFCPTL
jgi:hypothetical protein